MKVDAEQCRVLEYLEGTLCRGRLHMIKIKYDGVKEGRRRIMRCEDDKTTRPARPNDGTRRRKYEFAAFQAQGHKKEKE